MKCPNGDCSLDVEAGALPSDSGEKRVVSRFVKCSCGTVTNFRALEGWERWYALFAWRETNVEDVRRLDDRDVYYARLDAERPLKRGLKLVP